MKVTTMPGRHVGRAAQAARAAWSARTARDIPGQLRREELPVLPLVVELCRRLQAEEISYCHWKSNEAVARSASGDNDLDLLVRRADFTRFLGLLNELGFKEARPPAERELPGVLHYYGLDVASGRLVHVHTQAQLILGDDTTKNYRLPIEDAYLDSAEQGPIFALPSADLELAVFVVRMVLKHATWDAIAYGRGRLGPSERRELAWLEERTTPAAVRAVVHRHLRGIEDGLWDDCVRCLRPGTSARHKVRAAHRLRAVLSADARYTPSHDTALRIWRRAVWGGRRYVLRKRTRKQLLSGGAVVAVVGGDGAGKSSAVDALARTLGRTFATTRLHLGKPPRSGLTLAVKGPMAVARHVGMFSSTRVPPWAPPAGPGESPSYAWLVWHLLNARDRYDEYARARRLAGQGQLVICDRFPLPELTYMDGSRTAALSELGHLARPARWMVERERSYYARIHHPDVLVVMRLHPEIAVSRRHDEPEHFVRVRNQQVYDLDWSAGPAIVVDAARPQDDVLREILHVVWSRL